MCPNIPSDSKQACFPVALETKEVARPTGLHALTLLTPPGRGGARIRVQPQDVAVIPALGERGSWAPHLDLCILHDCYQNVCLHIHCQSDSVSGWALSQKIGQDEHTFHFLDLWGSLSCGQLSLYEQDGPVEGWHREMSSREMVRATCGI